MMIAQITQPGLWPTVEHIALLAALIGNIALVAALFRKNRIEPQPLEVKQAEMYARERDCLERHEDSKKQLAELRVMRGEDAKASSISRRAIYEEIKKTEASNRQHIDEVRVELSDKIDNMPSQIITTLRNFGAIGGQ
jgi:hypothetical protein